MSRMQRWLLGAALGGMVIGSLRTAAAEPALPTREAALEGLRSEHPRLLATAADFQRLKSLCRENARAQAWFDRLHAEAAVVSVRHPKWDERPLLVVVKKPGATVSREELLQFFEGRVAKWWIPDDVVFVDQLPHTATGKLLKTKLREDFKDYRLPTS